MPRAECARTLSKVLADTYLLYLKTHNFHWNVEGPRFRSLHQMFEEQYQALWTSVDEIAEQIRAGLLTDRLTYHEKQIWMMKSTLTA